MLNIADKKSTLLWRVFNFYKLIHYNQTTKLCNLLKFILKPTIKMTLYKYYALFVNKIGASY